MNDVDNEYVMGLENELQIVLIQEATKLMGMERTPSNADVIDAAAVYLEKVFKEATAEKQS